MMWRQLLALVVVVGFFVVIVGVGVNCTNPVDLAIDHDRQDAEIAASCRRAITVLEARYGSTPIERWHDHDRNRYRNARLFLARYAPQD
jgi:hypothetical protein